MVQFENPALSIEWDFDQDNGFLTLLDEWLIYGNLLVNCDIEATCTAKYYAGDYYNEPSCEITSVSVEIANMLVYDSEGDRIYPENETEIELAIQKYIKQQLS